MTDEKSELIRSLMAIGDGRPDRSIYLGTHSGEFHADDVLATAVLFSELVPLGYKPVVLRSRCQAFLDAKCDIIYDVGHGKYDHHDDYKVLYPNGIKMAACGKILNDVVVDQDLLEGLRNRLFYAVEAGDNGQELPPSIETSKLAFVASFNPTWGEPRTPKDFHDRFMHVLPIVGNIYDRTVRTVIWDLRSRDYINQDHAKFLFDGRFVELDKYCPTFEYAKTHPEFLGAIYKKDSQWTVRLAPSFRRRYETRCKFPAEWWGLHSPNEAEPQRDLRTVCPLKSARFCHPAGFIMAFDSHQDAVDVCKIILEQCIQGESVNE